MDDKTAELRDIFIDATGSDTVTESQSESPGSLTDGETDVTERLDELVDRMRERYEFETELDNKTLCHLLRGYHDEQTDREIAAELEVDAETVLEARLDLHLVRDTDREGPLELDALRQLIVEDISLADRAQRLDVTEETARHYSAVVEADLRSTRANSRFRDEFAELLTDSDLTAQLARDTREDGLKEATEDIETDVSF